MSWANMSREERLRHNITKGSGEWAAERGFNSIADVNAAFGDERPGRQTSVVRDNESFQDFVERQHTQASDQLAAIRNNEVDWAPLIQQHGSKVAAAQAVGQSEAEAIQAEADRLGIDLQQNGQSYIGMNSQVNNALYGPGATDAWTPGIPDGPDFRGPEGDTRDNLWVRDLILDAGLALATGGGGLFGSLGSIAQSGVTANNVFQAARSANEIYQNEQDRNENPDFVFPEGYSEGYEAPPMQEVSAEEMDFEISRGPTNNETLLDWLNRLQNLEEADAGGGQSEQVTSTSQQMNPVLGGMQGNPPELGEPEDEWVWDGRVLVNTSTGEERDVPNPSGLVIGGVYTGDAELLGDPDEEQVLQGVPSSVYQDLPTDLILSNGGQFGGTNSVGGNSPRGVSSSGSNRPGGLTTGQPPPESGFGNGSGTGTGSGSGSGTGSGTGAGNGSGSNNNTPEPPAPQTPISDSIFGSDNSSSDLFPYTVINPSRAANLGGLMDYVSALNQRRIR